MNKNEIFFGENGLTSTSANYIANKAKEYIRTLEEQINNVSFVSKSVKSIIDNNDNGILNPGTIISIGLTENGAHDVVTNIRKVAEIKSLIAWLREAIKAKNELTYNVKAKVFVTWMNDNGYEMKFRPDSPITMSEDDYLASLSIKERNVYFEYETKAAVIGKLIHDENAPISKARKELAKRISNPVEVYGEGQDALIYTYTPTIKSDDVDKIFFGLQEEYREAQAQLNSIKYKMETTINEDKSKKINIYHKQLDEYNTYQNKKMEEYREWQRLECIKISALKIIIPNDLKETYEFINNL